MVNLIDIRNLTSSSTVAQAFFEQLAGRVKNYRVTTVDHAIRLTGGSSRKQVVDLFKKMEELGLGHFIVGRRNGTSRFEWSVGMVETGQAALGESEDIEAIDESELEIAEMSEEEEEEEEESLFVEHSFVLRRNEPPVVFKLPIDLSVREAERISKFIQTLPINE